MALYPYEPRPTSAAIKLTSFALALASAATLAAGAAVGADSRDHESARSVNDSSSGRHVAEAARERDRQRKAHRDSDAGRQERERSRTAYRGQSDAEAHQTARTQFPQLIGPWPTRSADVGPGEEPKRYLSDNAALVELDGGNNAVVESVMPLRGRQPDGDMAPVDLALTEVGAALAPKSSATKVRMPQDLSGKLRFPDSSFGVGLAGAREDSTASLTYGKAFYANALEDTDLVLQATPLGAEVSLVLRSPESPTPALNFDLAPGQRLRLVAQDGHSTGEAEIVAGDERVALIGPALAADAQGEGVGIHYEVHGSRLVMELDTSGEVAWPVALDPVIYEKNDYGQPLPPGPGASWAGWSIRSNNNRGACAGPAQNAFWSCPIGDATIWIKAYGGHWYVAGDYSAWMNYARGGAYIFRFDVQAMSHYEEKPWTIAFNGVCNAACNAWMPGTWASPSYATGGPQAAYSYGGSDWAQTRYFCVNGQAPPVGACTGNGPQNNSAALGNAAQFGLEAEESYPATAEGYATINGAAVYKSDNSPPRVSSVSHSPALPSAWVLSYSDTATVTAVDNGTTGLGPNQPGMGMGSVTVTGGAFSQTRSTCGLSNNYGGCPTTWPAPGIAYTAPEGRTTFTASAKDIIENQSVTQDNMTWETKVDATAPAYNLPHAGSLSQPASSGWITDPSPSLTVNVSDPSPNGGQVSGVKFSKIEYDPPTGPSQTKNNNKADGSEPPCDAQTGCLATVPHTFGWSNAPDGTHSVKVSTDDAVGHPVSSTWNVKLDRQLPTFVGDPTGTLYAPGRWITSSPKSVQVTAQDATSGIKKVELLVSKVGQAATVVDTKTPTCCPTTPYGATLDWTPGAGDTEGTYDVKVRTYDDAHPTQPVERSWQIKLDKADPSFGTMSGSLNQRSGWITDPPALTVPVNDSGSGMKKNTIQIDPTGGPFDTKTNKKGDGTDCDDTSGCATSLSHSWSPTMTDGTHTVQVRAEDAVAKPVSDTWTVKLDRALPTFSATPTGSLYLPGTWVGGGTKSVQVQTADATSGIRKVELLVSKAGQPPAVVDTKTPTCCPATYTTTLGWTPAAGDTDGVYDVKVRVFDDAHPTQPVERTWQIMLDRAGPSGTLTDYLKYARGTVTIKGR